ncbi:clustered mitochondria protein homolog [Alosa pseudoharengus]|uniref:clustered mitochondria protein homolog n=1 Tax=Alosa pseudoharengus TaxID=34774 RepID=UPI003F8C5ECD
MGNVLSCCHNLSGQQLQPKEMRGPDPEWSPLLSEENSDEDCPSPSQATGEAEKSPVLDQGHAFFPDIVLSSSPGAALAIAGHSLRPDQGVWNPSFVPDSSEGVQAVIMQPYREEDSLQVDLHTLYGPGKPEHNTELFKQTVDPTEMDIDPNKHNLVLMGHMDQSVEGAESDVLQDEAADAGWTEGGILRPGQQAAARTTHRAQHMEHNANQKQQDVGQTRQGVTEQMELRTGQTEWPLEHGAFPDTVDLVKERTLPSEHKSQAEQGVTADQNVALQELGLVYNKDHNGTQMRSTDNNLVQLELNGAQTKRELKTIGQIEKDAAQVRQSGDQTTHSLVHPQGAAAQLFQNQDQALPTDQELMPVYLNVSDEALQGEEQKEQLTLFMVDRLFLATPPITGPCANAMRSGPLIHDQEEGALATWKGDSDVGQAGDANMEEVSLNEDTSFTVKIQAPGIEPINFQVSSMAMVQELKQLLMDYEETCHRTCFSLQLDGSTLDNFTHMKSISGLQDGCVLKTIDEPYTVREVRIHLRHIRNLLRSLDPTDAYNGVDCRSLSFLRLFTDADMRDKPRKRGDELKQESCGPPDYILPGSKECPLSPLQPAEEDAKPLEFLRALTMSNWNPPPGNRKMHGDLMYLNVVTLEERHFSITASVRGFYLNQSTSFSFNPKPANPSVLSHDLVDLLNHISPSFKKNFSALLKKRVHRHPFERLETPFQLYSWTAPKVDHYLDSVRAEDAQTSRMGYEEHIPGQTRDWNEELQSTRELPRKNLAERLLRERAIFKTNSDFVTTATRGAMAVIDGNVMPLNPGDEPHMHMFIWNNIFFSLGFDVKDHYLEQGGDPAAHSAPTNDLKGVRAYASIDAEGLHTLGTVVVDYRGYRVTAQSIVPGLLDKDQEQSVIYGSIDFGKTIVSDARFVELLEKTSRHLRIQRHLVLNKKDERVELCSSVECKGIVGNDRRFYVLDLIRTFPSDLNFLPSVEEHPPESQRPGFPRQHRHRLVCLRQELVELFIEHRYYRFLEMVNRRDGPSTATGSEDTDMQLITLDDSASVAAEKQMFPLSDSDPDLSIAGCADSVLAEACKMVGSTSTTSFDIRFNPNAFCPVVRFPEEQAANLQTQRLLIKEAAAFLINTQIPALVKSCMDHTTLPMDGATLTEALHRHGVNVRYLGTVVEAIESMPEREKLDYVHRISAAELITRCTKHLFRTYFQAVEPSSLSASVAHFLNCFLSSYTDTTGPQTTERRRSRRRKSRVSGAASAVATSGSWVGLTSKELWRTISAEAQEYYHYALQCESVEQAVEKYSVQRITLLREIAIKTGIQVLLKEYHFENKRSPTFTEEDILNIFPVVKHIRPNASDAILFFQSGQTKVQEGLLKEGSEMIAQALGLFTNVYGVMHEQICACLRLLGRIHYILGDYAEALNHQQKAVLMSERVLGIENPHTVQEYMHLGLYCFAGAQPVTSLRLLYRARYLILMVCGEDHPEMALLDSKIGLVLHALTEYSLSLRFLENALSINIKYHGLSSLKVAHSHYLVAKAYESKGEFRSALQHEKECYAVYKKQLGEHHDKTKESSEYLKHLTQQAVTLQRTMNMIYQTSHDTSIAPLHLDPPSRIWILEQLNLISGVVLIPLSNKDLENLRDQALKTQSLAARA